MPEQSTEELLELWELMAEEENGNEQQEPSC